MKTFKHRIYSRRYLILNTLFSLHTGFIGAVYVVYFYELGFSKVATNALSSVFMISVFLMEIPSGAYADVFGKRRTLIGAGIFLVTSMLLFMTGESFVIFAISQFLWGLSYAFASGASESWIINELKLKGRQLDNLFAKTGKVTGIFIAIGGLLGGVLSDFDIRLPWLLSVLTSLAYVIMTFIYVKDNGPDKIYKIGIADGLSSIKSTISNSITYGFKNKVTRRLIGLNLILAFCFSPVFVYWSPYLKELSKGGFVILGQIWILIKIANLFGNYITEKITKIGIPRITTISVTIFIASLSVLFAGIIPSFIIALILFLLFEITLGIFSPVINAYINDRLPDKQRSTILSFVSMLTRGSNFLALYIMGIIGDNFGISVSWIIAGSILLLCGIIISIIIIRNRDSLKQ